jgi:hypothetical protein
MDLFKDLNAVEQLLKGNDKPAKRKLKNKIKKRIINKISK